MLYEVITIVMGKCFNAINANIHDEPTIAALMNANKCI